MITYRARYFITYDEPDFKEYGERLLEDGFYVIGNNTVGKTYEKTIYVSRKYIKEREKQNENNVRT